MTTDAAALLVLLNWMSPAFPIGGYAYSHGLEQVIAGGDLRTPADVRDWIAELLDAGSGWNDAVLFSLCWTEPAAGLNQMALALAGSAERYMESAQLGRSFSLAAAVWTGEKPGDDDWAYAVAAGRACARMGLPRDAAVAAFSQNFCAALVSAAVRLVPLGQTAGLAVLRDLAPAIRRAAARAGDATLDDLGGHCIASEIAAMRHEALEPRIFRT